VQWKLKAGDGDIVSADSLVVADASAGPANGARFKLIRGKNNEVEALTFVLGPAIQATSMQLFMYRCPCPVERFLLPPRVAGAMGPHQRNSARSPPDDEARVFFIPLPWYGQKLLRR